jgi:hypothetical protein
MMRRLLSTWVSIGANHRRVHDRPFRSKQGEELGQQAQETAREALLQFNLMVERGVEPDALTYTSLIATMAKARLEWQAYKLFSRMLEHNVRPMPETYVALRDATSPKRKRLYDDLTRKIEESVEQFPQELALAVEAKQKSDDLKTVARFDEYVSGDDALFLDEPSPSVVPEAAATPMDASYKRVHIRNPADVWGTHKALEDAGALGGIRDAPAEEADTQASLKSALSRLDDEELRVFLAVKKQLRHGDKDALVARVVQTVGALAIREMLQRRAKYFKSVGDLLEIDLKDLKEGSGGADTVATSPPSSEPVGDVLQTPWGFIHKPKALASRKGWEQQLAVADNGTAAEVPLTTEELDLIYRKAQLDELDDIPISTLRRYAFRYQLRWRRKISGSLADIVMWHAKTILPSQLSGRGVSATLSLRRQQHEEDMKKTLENFEAFRIISQRTKNLQVVDSKEINLSINKAKLATNAREKYSDVNLRRETHIKEANMLQRQAREFMPVTALPTSNGETRVLGGGSELPPWALESDSGTLYNFTTKRFGDPTKGSLQELSDGKFRLMPNREAQDTHVVEHNSLPTHMRDALQQAELVAQQIADAKASELEDKLGHRKFKKFSSFVEQAKRREQLAKDALPPSMKPVKPKHRMVSQLRRGKDSDVMDAASRDKFFRSSL